MMPLRIPGRPREIYVMLLRCSKNTVNELDWTIEIEGNQLQLHEAVADITATIV